MFPIIGTAITAVGMLLLSNLGAGTSTVDAAVKMLVVGVGLGFVMQVLILAVQNAVSYEEPRGGDVGRRRCSGRWAAPWARRSWGRSSPAAWATSCAARLPAAAGRVDTAGSLDPAVLKRLPPPVHDGFVSAFTHALSSVFLVAAVVAAVAFLLSWLIEERPLRQTVETRGLDDVFAAPRDTTSTRELLRELSRAVGRRRTRDFVEAAAERAGIALSSPEIVVLGRVAHGTPVDAVLFGDRTPEETAQAVGEALGGLRSRGLVGGEPPELTSEGEAMYGRVREARRAALRALVEEWDPRSNPDIDPLIRRVAESLEAEDEGREPVGAPA